MITYRHWNRAERRIGKGGCIQLFLFAVSLGRAFAVKHDPAVRFLVSGAPGAHDAAGSNSAVRQSETCGVQEDEKLPLSATRSDSAGSGKRKLFDGVATELIY